MMINYTLQLVAAYTMPTGANEFTILLAMLIAIIGPFAGTYVFMKNASKIFSAATGAISKAGAGARKWANGWAKERQGNSRFARARAWNKALKEQNRIERQGKMTGFQGALNKAASLAAGPNFNPKKWKENAGKYQASAQNRAANEAAKIMTEDRAAARDAYAKNGIAGPLMVEHARSGRAVKELGYKDGKMQYAYGRKLTQAEHAEAVAWVGKNGKQSERDYVVGSAWAAGGRNDENSVQLDVLNDAYFHENGDVGRYGNRHGGKITGGVVGGDIGVNNGLLMNMAAGKTASKAIIENDVSQNLADLQALGRDGLLERVRANPYMLEETGMDEDTFVTRFLENAQAVAASALADEQLQSSIKPEFRGNLEELSAGTPKPGRKEAAEARFKEMFKEKDFEKTGFTPADIKTLQPAMDKQKKTT